MISGNITATVSDDIPQFLFSANSLLYKIGNYVIFSTLKAIYFVTFDLHINYANLIWGAKTEFQVQNYFFTKKNSENYK